MFSFQEEARKHFNCPILEGMELENQGGMGTELNHWEKRLLEVSADTGNGGDVGMSAAPTFIFRFIVVPPGTLKIQVYQTSLKCISNKAKLQILKCTISS